MHLTLGSITVSGFFLYGAYVFGHQAFQTVVGWF